MAKKQFLTGSSSFARFMEREMESSLVMRYSRWDVWRSFCSWTLASLQSDQETLDELAGRYPEAVPAWAAWFEALKESIKAEPFCDALGSAYMSLQQGSKGWGQFFTPKPVAQCMAGMMLGEERKAAPGRLERGCEPTCGSGVMVLAAAEILAQQDMPPILWTLMDLDMVCCEMAAIQLFLNDIPALVLCCNSLFFGMSKDYTAKVVSPRLWLPRADGSADRLAEIETEGKLHWILDQMEESVLEAMERRRMAAEPAV